MKWAQAKSCRRVAPMNWLRHDRQQLGPFTVVVPLSTMPSCAETFDDWTSDADYVVASGHETTRSTIRKYELLVDSNTRKANSHALLTTYDWILADAAFLSQVKSRGNPPSLVSSCYLVLCAASICSWLFRWHLCQRVKPESESAAHVTPSEYLQRKWKITLYDVVGK